MMTDALFAVLAILLALTALAVPAALIADRLSLYSTQEENEQ
jgi:hypothetical protein